MKKEVVIDAYVSEIRSNGMGDRSEKATVAADYEAASVGNSVTFQIPIAQANQFFVGQKINIIVSW